MDKNITRASIVDKDGRIDIRKVNILLKSGVTIFDLPLESTFYARVSTDQEEQITSFNSQISYFTEKISESKHWNLANEGYWDKGITGTSTEKREGFKRMINDALNGKFDLIITKEVSRFARNIVDTIQICRDLKDSGIIVFFETDNIISIDPDVEFRLGIMAGVAQEESRKTHTRVKWGNQQAIKNGVVLGNSKMFGYYKDKNDKRMKGKLIINEEEAEMVRLIFDLYANQFYGLRKICRVLFDKGYRNSNGGQISETTIKRIIRNPKYKGYYCGGKTTKNAHLSKKITRIDPEEWVMWKDETGKTVPAIVSEEIWDKANRLMDMKVTVYKDAVTESNNKVCFNGGYLFSSKIFCEEHNTAYCRGVYRYPRKDGSVFKREVWQCGTYLKGGRKACDKPVIYTDEMSEIIKALIEYLLENKETLLNKIDSIIMEAGKGRDYSKLKDSILADISTIKNRRDKLLDLLIKGRIKDEDFDKRDAAMSQQIAEKEQKIKEIEVQEKEASELVAKTEQLKADMIDILNFNGDLNRGIVDALIHSIVVKATSSKKDIQLDIYIRCSDKPLPINYIRSHNTSVRSQLNPLVTTNVSEEDCNTSICSPLEGWLWC